MATATERVSIHGQWSSRAAFFLAATGSAVGLGNIWKFPYMTGKYGGAAFVLVYLLCVAAIGLPIMMAEVMLGRRGRRSPINTMRLLALEEGRSRIWQYIGWIGVLAGVLILSYYSVIGGWALAYVFRTGSGLFDGQTMDGVRSLFADFVTDPEHLLAWHTIFMVMTIVVVSHGVKSGLERAVRYLMPALALVLLVLVAYSANEADFGAGLRYLFRPDFSKIGADGLLVAMGHAFFTLSLGMGAIMVYGSYLPRNVSIGRAALAIVIADTAIALLAGMAVFPLVFSFGLRERISGDPGLLFDVFPYAFGHMPGGALFGTLFFVLLVFAAWTSAISLLEPAVSWLVENRRFTRVRAAAVAGILTWALGIGSIFAFTGVRVRDLLQDIGVRSDLSARFFDYSFFNLIDYLTANIMLPLAGLSIAIFAGWAMSAQSSRQELGMRSALGYRLWHLLIRYITPIAVTVVFLNAIGAVAWLRAPV